MALGTPATQRFSQQNTAPYGYTMEELRNMPRPPGDYSGVDTTACPAAAEFFQNGTVPDEEEDYKNLPLFCIRNRLGDALSYFFVSTDCEWLIINPDNDDTGMVCFICEWAANIDFEIQLDFRKIQHDEDAQHISRMLQSTSNITRLNIKFKKCPVESEVKLLSSLSFNTGPRELNITKISDGGVKKLCEVLYWNKTIEHLAIYKKSMNDETANPLFDRISKNTSLTSLTIGVMDNTSQLIPILSKAIEKNTSLESLKLDFSKWSLDSAHAFAAALGKNTHLSSVHIDSIYFHNPLNSGCIDTCDFDHDAVAVLFMKLESNTTLKVLTFNYCKLGDHISVALKDFISTNKKLTELKLYNCDLGNRSATAIAEALPTNSSLRSLDIGGNFPFRVHDWSQIIKSCKTQCPLTTLKLCRVSWERGSFYGQYNFPVADLVEMIRTNTRLEVLDLSCYSSEFESFSIEQLRQISAALDSNHTLVDFIIHDEDQLMARKMEFESASNDPGRIVYYPEYDKEYRTSMTFGNDSTPINMIAIPFYPTQESASTITRFKQYDSECDEIAGKVGANARAQQLRFGAMRGLAACVPYLPIEPMEIIVDELILLNHEAPDKSGLEAMRSLMEAAKDS